MVPTQIIPLRDTVGRLTKNSSENFHAHFLNVSKPWTQCPLIRLQDVTGGELGVWHDIPHAMVSLKTLKRFYTKTPLEDKNVCYETWFNEGVDIELKFFIVSLIKS